MSYPLNTPSGNSLQYPTLTVTGDQHYHPERKSYLPSVSKLELVIHRGKLYIKSVNDSHQLPRILLFSLLCEAYTISPQLRESIKRIFSKQTLSVSGKAVENKLLKLINEIPINNGANTEKALMDLFVDSTDTDFMSAFLEAIGSREQSLNELEWYKEWVKQKFDVEVRVAKKEEEREDGGLVLYDKDGAYMKSSCQSIKQFQWIGQQQAFGSAASSIANSASGKQTPYDVLELDIETSLPKPKYRESGNLLHHNLDDNEQISQFLVLNPVPISTTRLSSTSSTRNKPPKPFSIWDYLCC